MPMRVRQMPGFPGDGGSDRTALPGEGRGGLPPGHLRLHVLFHESQVLGAGTAVLRTLEPLAAFGWTACGWFPGDGPLFDKAADVLGSRARHPKPIAYSARGWKAPPGAVERLRQTPEYLRAVRAALLASRPHVVHANTLRALPEASVAKRLGLPVVVHVHELPPRGAKRTLTLRWASRVADVLVGVSSAVSDLLREHAGATPVLTVHNGVPAVEVDRTRAEPATVGTVGTVCSTKGTDVFLEAAALALERRPHLRFEHIGQTGLDHDVGFRRRVEELARSPELRASVAMLGRRPAGEGLARWGTFVLPSRQDAFPLATLEAMSAGLPVVATDVGGLSEQIEHLETGVLVPPDDAAALAEWVVRLHDDHPLRQRLGSAAARRVRTTFTLWRQAEALHRAYLAALTLRYAPQPVRRATRRSL